MLIAAMLLCCGRCVAAPPLMIRLRPVVETSERTVRLSDVAQLSLNGQNTRPQQLQQLQEADLAVIASGDALTLIDKSMIDVRLRLLGLQQHEYRLLGPEQIIVRIVEDSATQRRDPRFALLSNSSKVSPLGLSLAAYAETISDGFIEQAVQASLARQFNLAEEDVKAQLMRSFVDERMSQQKLPDNTRIEVVSPTDFPFGRTTLTVQFWEGGRLTDSRSAYFDIRRRQQVLVARKTLSRASVISQTDVTQETRFVDGRRDELQLADVSGQSPSRTIRPGEILTLSDFPVSQNQQISEQLIRARDAVRIVGHRKNLQFVVPAAEALQSGRMGQLIRVRNLHSNKTIVARVTGRGEVEVPLE